MRWRVVFLDTNDGKTEPRHQRTIEMANLIAVTEWANKRVRDTYSARLVSAGTLLHFVIYEGGRMVYPHAAPAF
jgi:hypothetical protein